MQANCWDDEADYDYAVLVEGLHRYLRLKTMLIALPPSFLPQVVEGLKSLSANGLRYSIPNHGIQKSHLDSIRASYGGDGI
jgi:hypothetical protein